MLKLYIPVLYRYETECPPTWCQIKWNYRTWYKVNVANVKNVSIEKIRDHGRSKYHVIKLIGNIYNLNLTIAMYDQQSKKTEFDNKPVSGDKKTVYSRLGSRDTKERCASRNTEAGVLIYLQ